MVAEPIGYNYEVAARNWNRSQRGRLVGRWDFLNRGNATSIFNESLTPPILSPQVYDPCRELRREFERLTEEWRDDTRHLSLDQQIATHPSYKAIIRKGRDVLPLIFEALENELDHWFYALATITQENPVPPSEAGDIEAMQRRWLEWGRRNGYLRRHAA
jgi:hypothetical protein